MLVAPQNNGQSFSKDMLVAGQEGPVFSEGQVGQRVARPALSESRGEGGRQKADDQRVARPVLRLIAARMKMKLTGSPCVQAGHGGF